MEHARPAPKDSFNQTGGKYAGIRQLPGRRNCTGINFRDEFEPGILLRDLSVLGKVKVAETKKGTFHGFIDGIRVTWLMYPNPLLNPLINVKDVPGLQLASLTDIAVMKWATVSQRGARKDFIDLFYICQYGYNLEGILNLLPKKYPKTDINYYHMIKSLSFFDDAERETMPVMMEK